MKKLELKRWVKVVITIILLIFSFFLYVNLKKIGNMQIGLIGWGLLISQIFMISLVWEN